MGIKTFNKIIDIWINGLDSFTIDQIVLKPDEKNWSLGQVYEHIVEETNWYNEQLEISLSDIENANAPTTIAARKLFKNGSFADERIVGDPLISENVKQPTSIEQLKSDFEKLKTRTNENWLSMTKAITYGISEHPGMGYLNCFEWLYYSEMHMRHHLKQKSRIEDFLNLNQEQNHG